MDTNARNNMIKRFLLSRCFPLLRSKGATYAGTDQQPDANANFKRAARQWGVTPLQAWGVYFGKHVDAIASFVRGNYADPEPIDGRIVDLVNYALILYTLLHEDPDAD